MKHITLFGAMAALLALGLMLVTGAFAQPGTGGRQGGPQGGSGMPPGPPPPAMRYVNGSLFVLLGGTLQQLDGKTLKTVNTATLFTPTPPDGEAGEGQPPMRPPLQAIGEGAGGRLQVVADGTLYLIDGRTLKVVSKTALPEIAIERPNGGQGGPGGMGTGRGQQGGPADRQYGRNQQGGPGGQQNGRNQQGGPGGGRGPMGPPRTEMSSSTLYLLHGPHLAAIDLASGKVIAQVNLQGDMPQATRTQRR